MSLTVPVAVSSSTGSRTSGQLCLGQEAGLDCGLANGLGLFRTMPLVPAMPISDIMSTKPRHAHLMKHSGQTPLRLEQSGCLTSSGLISTASPSVRFGPTVGSAYATCPFLTGARWSQTLIGYETRDEASATGCLARCASTTTRTATTLRGG